ncbi:MAG: hypothetical protein M1381_11990 [Deltaproteobacteria bacterium]|nr:hypothetical protein [Deltaproteobacteria bacterium]
MRNEFSKIENIEYQDASPRRYPDDYEFVQLLITGDTKAWDKFYREIRKKMSAYLNNKYPSVFSDVAAEEICDCVQNRLMKNENKALKEYRGNCMFNHFITQATDWEIKDWLRRHSKDLIGQYTDNISETDLSMDDIGSPQQHSAHAYNNKDVVPDILQSLDEELRWTFLLRYYDYFGFPLKEIRLMAKKKGVSVGSITKKIINFLEPEGDDLLRKQREKQAVLKQKLSKIYFKLYELNTEEDKLAKKQQDKEKSTKLDDVKSKRLKLQKRQEELLGNKAQFIITTPYEVIAEILTEENISTIRSRVFWAKKQLIKILLTKHE